VIPAGGSGKLVAKVRTRASQEGKISKTIRVTTDDPGARTIVLKLQADVEAPVKVYPRRRAYLGVVEGERAEVRLVLRRKDGKPLQVKKLKVRDPSLLTARWEEVGTPGQVAGYPVDRGDVVLVITSAERIRGTSRATVVEVTTDVPEEPVVEIPVSVRVRPRIQVSPPQAHLILPSRGGAGTVRMVRIASTTGTPFRILGIENSLPRDVEVEFDPDREATQHTITLRVTGTAAAKELALSLRGKLVVRTDEPKAPEVEIRMIVERRLPSGARPGRTIEPVRHTPVQAPPGGVRLRAAPGTPVPVGTPVPAPTAVPRKENG